MPQPLHWEPITTEVDGQTFYGEYAVDGVFVRMRSQHCPEKTTQVGASPAETVAKNMLYQCVSDWGQPGKVREDLRKPKP